MTRVLIGAAPVIRWEWSFGDGATSTERNPVHAYAQPGLYTVSLAVNSATVSDVRVRPNYIEVTRPPVPKPEFMAATRAPVAGDPVQFVDLSVAGAGEITGWLWDFGDGGHSTLQNPVHIYTAAAVYDVYLTITTTAGKEIEVKLGYIDAQQRKS
jgi:PKD repeat protein